MADLEVWELGGRGPIVCPICFEPDDAVVDLAELGGVVPMPCGHVPTVTAWLEVNASRR